MKHRVWYVEVRAQCTIVIVRSVPAHVILGIKHSADTLEESGAFPSVWAREARLKGSLIQSSHSSD